MDNLVVYDANFYTCVDGTLAAELCLLPENTANWLAQLWEKARVSQHTYTDGTNVSFVRDEKSRELQAVIQSPTMKLRYRQATPFDRFSEFKCGLVNDSVIVQMYTAKSWSENPEYERKRYYVEIWEVDTEPEARRFGRRLEKNCFIDKAEAEKILEDIVQVYSEEASCPAPGM